MSELGLKLLTLQEEFLTHGEKVSLSAEFHKPEWAPRSKEDISNEYELTLRSLLTR